MRISDWSSDVCSSDLDAFPEAGLAPTPAERAGYYRWLFFAAGPVEAAVTAHAMGAEPQDERQQGMAGYGSFARVMDTLETSIPAEGYVEGPRFTAADLYLGARSEEPTSELQSLMRISYPVS